MNKEAMYNLSYGLFVLTSAFDGRDSGCIINTAGQVTAEPNRISLAVNKSNYTQELVQKSGKFNLSIISQKADFELFRHFGFQSGRTVDKFEGYKDAARSANGLYYITSGTNSLISASVEQSLDLPFLSLPWMTWRYCRMRHLPLTRIISLQSSPGRHRLPARERQCGAVRSAVTPMKGRSCRQILCVLSASTRLRILRKWCCK